MNKPVKIWAVTYNTIFVSVLILLVGLMPSFIHVTFHTSSLALGLFFLLCLYSIYLVKYIYVFKIFCLSTLVIVWVMLFYNLLYLFLNADYSIKIIASLCMLAIILIIANLCSEYLHKLSDKEIRDAVLIAFYVLTFIGISGVVFKLQPSFYYSRKAIFPFSEPSHFALFYGLFSTASFSLNSTSKKRIIPLVSTLFIGVYVQNMTILVYFVLMILLEIKLNFKKITSVICVVFFIVMLIFANPKYFLERVTISSDTNNISTLVYMQGIDDAYNSLIDTNGFGLGLQMLGTQQPSYLANKIAFLLGADREQNRKDGGFLAAKLIAEFGVFGIISLIVYGKIFIKALLYLKFESKKRSPFIVFSSIIMAFSVEIFVRGYGYFSPGVFLFMVAMFGQYKFNLYRSNSPPLLTIQ